MTKKLLVTFLSIFLVGGLLSAKAHAIGGSATYDRTDVNVCTPGIEGFIWSQLVFGTNIQKTLQDSIVGGVNVVIGGTEGATVDEIIGCDGYLAENSCINFDNYCNTTVNKSICEELSNQGSSGGTAGLDIRARGVRGSLLGMAYTLENLTYTEPLAVNFAYFWNRNLEKLPIVGKTFAAPLDYNMPLLRSAYDLWELVRNVSLGIISVILLYTGIMIILRKRVSSQIVVSVQYAIPKIVIGLLLIIFSYPIGSAITGISWGLYRGATSIVGSATGFCNGQVNSGQLYLAILIEVLKNGVGLGRVVLLLITGLAVVFMYLAVWVKAVLIYLKMVIGVITAPFEMAIGTIPGSEDKIMDWFKRMAKLGLSVFAMGLVVPVVLVLAYYILVNYRAGPSEVGGFGSLIRTLVPPLVIIYGFGLALGMEKTIGSFFGDDKKRK